MEYLFAPGQHVKRFHNTIRINAYSMRSRDFPRHKASPDEFRVLMLGDSVINGGALTDGAELATTLVEQRLSADLRRPVTVGNVSAGSWGPANLLAYVRQYGLFESDRVFLLLSSHDYGDAPTYSPLDPSTHPTAAPWSALSEALSRYLPRYFPTLGGGSKQEMQGPPPSHRDIETSPESLRELLRLAKESTADVRVFSPLGKERGAGWSRWGRQRGNSRGLPRRDPNHSTGAGIRRRVAGRR